ncbi:ATP-binding protein, partial [Streptomyces sp. SID4985]|nr:ATP-binding protein [Streptomyces sp. SID4985]
VADRAGDLPALAALTAAEASEARHDQTVAGPVALYGPTDAGTVTMRPVAEDGRAGIRGTARRNLVAAGSGALLVAVLGTVVTLGMTSQQGTDRDPAGSVEIDPSATQGLDDGNLGAVPKKDDAKARDTSAPSARPSGPAPSVTPLKAPAGAAETRGTGGGHQNTEKPGPKPSRTTDKPTSKPSGGSPEPDPSTSATTSTPTPPTTPASPTPTDPGTDPETSTSASGPAPSSASAPVDPASTDPGEVM